MSLWIGRQKALLQPLGPYTRGNLIFVAERIQDTIGMPWKDGLCLGLAGRWPLLASLLPHFTAVCALPIGNDPRECNQRLFVSLMVRKCQMDSS
jgi:hypothetical protein